MSELLPEYSKKTMKLLDSETCRQLSFRVVGGGGGFGGVHGVQSLSHGLQPIAKYNDLLYHYVTINNPYKERCVFILFFWHNCAHYV